MDREKSEAIATERMQLIAPLLGSHVDQAERQQIMATICAQSGVSDRTVRRYIARYQAEGFEGLKPRSRSYRWTDAIPEEIVNAAIQLRREAPHRSVRQIIQVLELEHRVPSGTLKRSTLQERLAAAGYSTRQMRLYRGGGVAARRFQRRHRNELWQSDIKYGPHLPIGANGAAQQVYLSVVIDDATRFVVHAAFYPTQDQTIVEDSLRQAMRRYGVPQRLYFDNGRQYRSRQMARIGAKLGIRVVYTKPFAPESKGKVEKFNRLVDDFLAEAALERPRTLQHLNELFDVWLRECYQSQPHSAVPQFPSPEAAFRGDPEPLRMVDIDTLTTAFLRVDTRKVDKVGCISFGNRKYEVGVTWVGQTVDVVYDPQNTEELTIERAGTPSWVVRPLVIGEQAGQRPALPDHLGTVAAPGSRVLQAAQQHQATRRPIAPPAVVFRGLTRDGGQDDV